MAKAKKRVKRIPQALLSDYHQLKQDKSDLDMESRKINKQIREIKETLEEMLEDGATVQKGPLTAQFRPGRKSVPWKQVFIEECGTERAEEIQANTPVPMSLWVGLVDE